MRRTRSPVSVGLGAMLAVVGASLVVLAVAVHGTYPTGLSGPVAITLGATGGIFIALALLTLVAGPQAPREGTPHLAIAALVVGAASLLAFIVLVLGNLSLSQSPTLPTAARLVPVGLGVVAALLGVLGLATSRRDASSIRLSSAALVMGLGSAIVPMWLWVTHCQLFELNC